MVGEFSVTIEHTGPLKRAMTSLSGAGATEVLRSGFTAGAVIVDAQARRDVHQVSGKLHDSTGIAITGVGWSTEAHIGPQPGFGGPRKGRSGAKGRAQNPRGTVNRSDPRDYARRYNLGFNGTDSIGRHYNQAPRRYLVEALNENRARIVAAVQRRIGELLASKLR